MKKNACILLLLIFSSTATLTFGQKKNPKQTVKIYYGSSMEYHLGGDSSFIFKPGHYNDGQDVTGKYTIRNKSIQFFPDTIGAVINDALSEYLMYDEENKDCIWDMHNRQYCLNSKPENTAAEETLLVERLGPLLEKGDIQDAYTRLTYNGERGSTLIERFYLGKEVVKEVEYTKINVRVSNPGSGMLTMQFRVRTHPLEIYSYQEADSSWRLTHTKLRYKDVVFRGSSMEYHLKADRTFVFNSDAYNKQPIVSGTYNIADDNVITLRADKKTEFVNEAFSRQLAYAGDCLRDSDYREYCMHSNPDNAIPEEAIFFKKISAMILELPQTKKATDAVVNTKTTVDLDREIRKQSIKGIQYYTLQLMKTQHEYSFSQTVIHEFCVRREPLEIYLYDPQKGILTLLYSKESK